MGFCTAEPFTWHNRKGTVVINNINCNFVLFKCPSKWWQCDSEPACTVGPWNWRTQPSFILIFTSAFPTYMSKYLPKVNTDCMNKGLTSILPPSPLQSDSVLPECSTTLKRLERPSVRQLRTGLSLVVVERAQAEPPPPPTGLWWRLHRLRSLEEDSSLEVEPKENSLISHSYKQKDSIQQKNYKTD